eukprot:gene3354-6642_t
MSVFLYLTMTSFFGCSYGFSRSWTYPKLNRNICMIDSFQDLFSDQTIEIDSPKKLYVEGTIPSWLRGSLIRNGPAIFGTQPNSDKQRQYDHIFDGLAKLSKYNISDEGVMFSTKFLRSNWYKQIVEDLGDIPPSITAATTEPKFGIIDRVIGAISASSIFDNVPVNVHKLGGKTWVATTDSPILLEFDPITLNTISRKHFKTPIISPGGVEFISCAHPHSYIEKCDITGKEQIFTYNIYLEMRPLPLPGLPNSNFIHIVRIDSSEHREVIGSLELPPGVMPYMHDFSITENYIILCVWPIFMDMNRMITSDKGFVKEMQWKGGDGDGDDEAFAFHHINAYEEIVPNNEDKYQNQDVDSTTTETNKDKINLVVDVMAYKNAEIMNGDHNFAILSNVRDPAKRALQARDARWSRYRLPLSATATSTSTSTSTSANTKTKTTMTEKTKTKKSMSESDSISQYVEPLSLVAIDVNGKEYGSELVRFDESRRGRKYRYSYGFTGFAGDGVDAGGFLDWALVKMDNQLATTIATSASATVSAMNEQQTSPHHTATIWKAPQCYPGEPFFVADPTSGDGDGDSNEEDAGVVMSTVYDAQRRESFLLILDARDMSEIARAYTGICVPLAFHGEWLPQ